MLKENEVYTKDELIAETGIATVRRGMHFKNEKHKSVLLMTDQGKSHYQDVIDKTNGIIKYTGQDPIGSNSFNPKNQTIIGTNRKLTQNGKFIKSWVDYVNGKAKADEILIFDNIGPNSWQFEGTFNIYKANKEIRDNREVIVFTLHKKTNSE